jgi:lipopolysaccharide transport system ATP-binding protein
VGSLLEVGTGFHSELTGRENVFLNGSLMGFSRRDMLARLDEIVDFSGIGDFIDMEVKHYSSGMYTRLAFAVATTVDPDILLTDEVLAVGDEAFQRKCMERIYHFRQMGKTIVFVSHALDTVSQLCDRAVWLDHGVARAIGPSREVINAYLEETNIRETEARRREAGDQPSSGSDQGWRHGTQEAEICAVELLGAADRPQELFYTGEPLTVRMHYDAHVRLERPQFGLAIYHASGIHITGPNNNFAGYPIDYIEGRGTVDYTIAQLPLLPGQYRLTVALHDSTGSITYDHHEQQYDFTVRSHALQSSYGLVEIPACWRHRAEL